MVDRCLPEIRTTSLMYTMGSTFNSREGFLARSIGRAAFRVPPLMPISMARDNCFAPGGGAPARASLRRLPTRFIFLMTSDAVSCHRVRQNAGKETSVFVSSGATNSNQRGHGRPSKCDANQAA